MNIIIPKRISTRTYFLFKENSKKYIINEKNRTHFELDGLSSDLYHILVNNPADLHSFVKKTHLENDVDAFLNELKDNDLILFEDEEKEASETIVSESEEELDLTDFDEFSKSRNNWLFDNGFLPSLFIELTYRCNLKCIHCYNPKDHQEVEIPFDKLKKIIDEAYELGVFMITLSGGESTTYSKFIELIEYIRSKRISLCIFTNGQKLYDDEFYQKVISLYASRIPLSLYGIDKNIHDNVTAIKGSGDKIVHVIEKLKKDNIEVQAKDFLLKENCKNCIETAKYCKAHNISMLGDISLIPTIEKDKKTFEHMISDEDLYQLYIDKDSPLYIKEEYKPMNIDEVIDSNLCHGGFNSVCVTPFLKLTICSSLPLELGDLNKDSLITIRKNGYTDKKSELYKWHSLTLNDLKECYKNSYCAFCNYCAGMAYLENGFLKKSDVLCRQAKIKEKAYYQLLKEREKR